MVINKSINFWKDYWYGLNKIQEKRTGIKVVNKTNGMITKVKLVVRNWFKSKKEMNQEVHAMRGTLTHQTVMS